MSALRNVARQLQGPSPKPTGGYALSLLPVVCRWYQIAVLQSNLWVGQPQSLLLDGVGRYNCSLVPSGFDPIVGDVKFCNATAPQCGHKVFWVEQGGEERR